MTFCTENRKKIMTFLIKHIFLQLQEVDEELKHEEVKTKERFIETSDRVTEVHEEISHRINDNVSKL